MKVLISQGVFWKNPQYLVLILIINTISCTFLCALLLCCGCSSKKNPFGTLGAIWKKRLCSTRLLGALPRPCSAARPSPSGRSRENPLCHCYVTAMSLRILPVKTAVTRMAQGFAGLSLLSLRFYPIHTDILHLASRPAVFVRIDHKRRWFLPPVDFLLIF